MSNNINTKTTPDQMRVFMGRMRNGKYEIVESEEKSKDLDIRSMLKITRNLNEEFDDQHKKSLNKKNVYDQTEEENKLKTYFDNMSVSIKFIELEVYDDLVFWGGTINGVIQFIFKVTPDETTSGVEFNYTDDFSPDNPENNEIIKKIETYYDSFYKYWRDNIVQQ
jgi:hypothetical protein